VHCRRYIGQRCPVLCQFGRTLWRLNLFQHLPPVASGKIKHAIAFAFLHSTPSSICFPENLTSHISEAGPLKCVQTPYYRRTDDLTPFAKKPCLCRQLVRTRETHSYAAHAKTRPFPAISTPPKSHHHWSFST
jgi:hypothetical protein